MNKPSKLKLKSDQKLVPDGSILKLDPSEIASSSKNLEDVVPRLAVSEYGVVDEENIEQLEVDERLFDDENSEEQVELDPLFRDKEKSKYDDAEVEVRQAINVVKTEEGQRLGTNKSAEATKKSKKAELEDIDTLEDEWDESDTELLANKKSTLLLLGIVPVILLGSLFVYKGYFQKKNITGQTTLVEGEQVSIELNDIITATEKLVESYKTSENLEDKVNLFHNVEKYRERILAYHHKDSNVKINKNSKTVSVFQELIGGTPVWSAVIKKEGRLGFDHQHIFFREQDDGSYKIDWPSFYGEELGDVTTFVRNQETTLTEVRARINPQIASGLYSWGFTEDKYAAFKMIVSDDVHLWGYVDKNNKELANKMNEAALKFNIKREDFRGFEMKMILGIQFPENTNTLA